MTARVASMQISRLHRGRIDAAHALFAEAAADWIGLPTDFSSHADPAPLTFKAGFKVQEVVEY